MPLSAPPVSLYLHLPWCARKCPYCDFNSHAATELPEARYVAALLEDWRKERERLAGRPLASAFFGGGTPSLFSPEAIAETLAAARADGALADGAEVSLEANPESTTPERLAGWRRAGVNRLSIGAQSFDERALRALGRIHDAERTVEALAAARQAGYTRLNLDLMYGLPGQDVAAAMDDLRAAVAQEPDHISWYQLGIEPNTAFYRDPPTLPDDEAIFEMHCQGALWLAAQGYRQYEVSAFARPGGECRHNRNYWEFGDYIGIGAGAHGKLSDAASGRIVRSRKTRMPEDYMRGGPTQSARVDCVQDERPLEFMMNALRLTEGCPSAYFEQRTGVAIASIAPTLERLREDGLLARRADRLQATASGLRYLNDTLAAFT